MKRVIALDLNERPDMSLERDTPLTRPAGSGWTVCLLQHTHATTEERANV